MTVATASEMKNLAQDRNTTTTLFWITLTPNGPHIDLNHDAILLPADPSNVADTVAHEPPSPGSNVAVDLPEEAIGLPGTLPDVDQ